MKVSRKLLVSAAVIGVVGLAGGGAALASGGTPSPQPVNPHPRLANAAPIDSSVESKFTPVTGCRIVDTRLAGGRIAAGASRSFFVAGTVGFAGQGGHSGGCGIPASATAVTLTVIAPNASGYGFFQLYPYGSPVPPSVFMTFSNLYSVSGGGTAQINPAGLRHLTVRAGGHPAHVVIDVNGYYAKPMTAWVSSNGTLLHGSRVTAVKRLTTGQYEVDFDRNVSQCTYAASPYLLPYVVGVEPRSGNPNGVFVYIETPGGTIVDQLFYLTVTC